MFYVTSVNCYINVRIFVDLLNRFDFMLSIFVIRPNLDFYTRNMMTGNVPTKANSFHVLSASHEGENAFKFINIKIAFTLRHMDQNICRLS